MNVSGARSVVRSSLGAALVTLLALVATEGVVRLVRPSPRVQVVRDGQGVELVEVGGVMSWRSNEPYPGFRGEACVRERPDALVVLVVGDSIPYATGPVAAPPFSVLLQQQLGEGWCVLNASEPAFHGWQQLAAFEDHLRRHRVDLAIWGQWKTDGAFVRAGEALVEVSGVRTGADGLPLAPLPVPSAAHAALFAWSAAWRFATLALVPPAVDARVEASVYDRQAAYARFVEQVAHGPTEGLVLLFPRLDAPFREAVARPRIELALAREHAASRGVPWIDVGELLIDQDVAALRADTCCHYGPAGHVALAERLLPWLRAWAARRAVGERMGTAPVERPAPGLPCEQSDGCVWPCAEVSARHPSGELARCRLGEAVSAPGLELAAGAEVGFTAWGQISYLAVDAPGLLGGVRVPAGAWSVDLRGGLRPAVGGGPVSR